MCENSHFGCKLLVFIISFIHFFYAIANTLTHLQVAEDLLSKAKLLINPWEHILDDNLSNLGKIKII